MATERTDATIVLIHSPSLGPTSWQPVREVLIERGHAVVVPDLSEIGVGGPPYWPRVAEAVTVADQPVAAPVLLVPHSNAGLFVPVIADALPVPVAGVVFTDAALPARPGPSPVAPIEFQQWLQPLADSGGLLPRWTDWWPSAEIEALLPDPAIRARVIADQPRLPIDYYQQQIPVPPSWPGPPAAYLRFSAAYDEQAATARAAGWPVADLPGEHLHQVVDPVAVAGELLRLASYLR